VHLFQRSECRPSWRLAWLSESITTYQGVSSLEAVVIGSILRLLVLVEMFVRCRNVGELGQTPTDPPKLLLRHPHPAIASNPSLRSSNTIPQLSPADCTLAELRMPVQKL
jgi:hypothetical protein